MTFTGEEGEDKTLGTFQDCDGSLRVHNSSYGVHNVRFPVDTDETKRQWNKVLEMFKIKDYSKADTFEERFW